MTTEQMTNILLLAGWQCFRWSSNYGAVRGECGDFFGWLVNGVWIPANGKRSFHTEYTLNHQDVVLPWPDNYEMVKTAYDMLDEAGLL